MGHPFELLRVLWVANIAVQTLVIVRLTMDRLNRAYPMFYAYLIADIVVSLAMINIPVRTLTYTIVWGATRSILFALQCLAVLELHNKVCEHYPGVKRYKGKLQIATAVAAAAACLIGSQQQIAHLSQPWYFYLPALVMRVVDSGLVVFLVLLWAIFRALDTIRVRRKNNVVLHLRLLAIYLGVNSCYGLLVTSVSGATLKQIYTPLSGCELVAASICLTIWGLRMTRAGEVMPAPPTLPFDADQIEAGIRELRYKIRAANPTV